MKNKLKRNLVRTSLITLIASGTSMVINGLYNSDEEVLEDERNTEETGITK